MTTMIDRSVMRRQAALYAEALMDTPTSDLIAGALLEAETTLVAHYAKADVAFTMDWWGRFCGQPILVNKLRARDNPIIHLNSLIHSETLAAMSDCPRCRRPACICPPGITTQPLWGDDPRGCGCLG
jgi:hypothetical protein